MFPAASGMEQIWNENRPALLSYLKLADTGVRGRVTDSHGAGVGMLTVQIDAREPFFKTTAAGEYFRLLLPGKYRLSLSLDCTPSTLLYSEQIEVPAASGLLQLNIQLNDTATQLYARRSPELNKYPVFCADNQKPPACSTNYTLTKRGDPTGLEANTAATANTKCFKLLGFLSLAVALVFTRDLIVVQV